MRPGEEPNSYSDEEEESSESGKANKSEDIKNINSTDGATSETATSDKPKDEWLKCAPIDPINISNKITKSLASVNESSNNSSNKLNNNEIIGTIGTTDQRLQQ